MRTLKVKCPTWQHVETFYGRKLRKDNTLTLRVPFHAEEGSQVTIGLQLPNDIVLNIEGTVIGLASGDPGQKNAVRLFLHGMTESLANQLKDMVAEGLRGHAAPAAELSEDAADEPVAEPVKKPQSARPATAGPVVRPTAQLPLTRPPTSTSPSPARSQSAATPAATPVSMPEDAPVDELLEQPFEPTLHDVSEYEREVFIYLDGELGRMRESAAHEVLGVDEEADVAEVRQAYFTLTKRFHPDLFARYRSRAIMHMAQELFIYINKAYDRMRDGLVAAGRAIVAGPALLPHDGWLAGFDDILSDEPSPSPSGAVMRPASDQRSGATRRPATAIEEEVLALLDAGSFETARERVASALHFDPRNRSMRALYHVISGRELLAAGEILAAATQFEAALAHDRDCRDARKALDELQARGQHSGYYPRSLR